jgi:di/tricarboxylate transporter
MWGECGILMHTTQTLLPTTPGYTTTERVKCKTYSDNVKVFKSRKHWQLPFTLDIIYILGLTLTKQSFYNRTSCYIVMFSVWSLHNTEEMDNAYTKMAPDDKG